MSETYKQKLRTLLENTRVLPQDHCNLTPVVKFMEHGHVFHWTLFSEDEFVEIMLVCAKKDPGHVLKARRRLNRFIREELVQQICIAAANELTTLLHQEFSELRLLPREVRLNLAKRIKLTGNDQSITAQFAVDLILEVEEKGRALYKELSCVFDQLDPATVYRCTYQQRIAVRQAGWLENALSSRLLARGYRIRHIEEEEHQGRTQRQIRDGDMLYIQDSRQYRYFPGRGDLVIFNPSYGRECGRNIFAVYFIPATNGDAY